MSKTKPPYTPEFRRQMVELVRTGRSPDDLAQDFEPTAQSIRNWVAQADRDAGRRGDGLTTAEREELDRLRRENRRLRLGSIRYRHGMAHLELTLVLDSGARIGPRIAALLERVHSTGSISAAARSMGLDYRRAWLLMDSLNRAFLAPAIERSIGGTGGGGAILTSFGQDLLERYRRLEAGAAALAKTDLEFLEQRATAETGPKI
jgi:molybdate transport system regulatory protein